MTDAVLTTVHRTFTNLATGGAGRTSRKHKASARGGILIGIIRVIVALLTGVVLSFGAIAQPTSLSPLAPPANSPRKSDSTWHAFTHATIHTEPGKVVEDATLVVRDGKIVAILEKGAPVPMGPRVWDSTGLHIYPAFIDAAVEVDAPAPDRTKEGVHWNRSVTPQRDVLDGAGIAASQSESLRKLGFGAAGIMPRGGIFRGTGAVVSLAAPSDERSGSKPKVYRERVYHAMSFDPVGAGGSGGGGERTGPSPDARTEDAAEWSSYPNSQMGSIALIRQTFLDADRQASGRMGGWYTDASNALDALAQPQVMGEAKGPFYLFDVDDELDALRVAKIAREFKREFVIIGSGAEYARLEAIKTDGLAFVLPLRFPRVPDVAGVGKAESVDLRELMAWEQAPTNPRRMDEAGITVALTSGKLGRGQTFGDNLAKAIQAGLKPDRAMAMLTTTPAKMLGVEKQLGTLERGKVASFVIADGPMFVAEEAAAEGGDAKPGEGDAGAEAAAPGAGPGGQAGGADAARRAKGPGKILDTWVDGIRHEIAPAKPIKLEGEWTVTIPGAPAAERTLIFDSGNRVTVKRNDKSVRASASTLDVNRLSYVFDHEPLDGQKGLYTMSGVVQNDALGKPATIVGEGIRPNGDRFTWSAARMPPTLAGLWRVKFEKGGAGPVLSLGAKNELSMFRLGLSGAALADAAATVVADATFDGKTLTYSHDQSLMGVQGTGVTRFSATADFESDPPVLSGTATMAGGQQEKFTATRVTLEGSWVVVEYDGKQSDASAKDALVATIAMDKSGATPVPTLTLRFNKLEGEPTVIKAEDVKIDGAKITFTHALEPIGGQGKSSDVVIFDGEALHGFATGPDGKTHVYKAVRRARGAGRGERGGERQPADAKPAETKPGEAKQGESKPADMKPPETFGLPFGPYAMEKYPEAKTYVITNATIWTSNAEGEVIENGTLVISNGKIESVRTSPLRGDPPSGWIVIDGTGKHIAPGIIDCHSHTGISGGVNESGQAVTAEVRIQDVTNPDSISWYRQLAGGVTAVSNLHGSANPIGGQNCVNKIRWGVSHPDDMHFFGRDAYSDENDVGDAKRASIIMNGIKFALGENVKQSNWGDRSTTRYPQTRMGVEAIIRDRFVAAREYSAAWKAFRESGGKGEPPRRDLELEPLAQILEGKRLIHCHSYRGDEIMMLARLAKEFNFKIGTFQHVLEGYKVADEIKASAIGASGFTDWWNFKVEVQDAIPFAFPIMNEAGVNVSYNSDSDELARRMNTEAAKGVKYGGGRVSDAEALKWVTINPAIQLAIDKHTGSIEAGKDADIAVWSASPLSSYARCERTFVDGRELFSLEQDAAHRAAIKGERQRIMQKILADRRRSPASGGGGSPGAGGGRGGSFRPGDGSAAIDDFTSGGSAIDVADDVTDEQRSMMLEMVRRGLDPAFHRPGVCGCGVAHQR
jgi:imidazolonepropionase-like amidohydrolase